MFWRFSRHQWIISLILILSLTKIYSSNDVCKSTKNCVCFNNSEHYEYQCLERELILHIYPNSSIQIDCNNVITFNSQILPKVTFKNIDKLKINYCPLPENGLKEIADHFGLQNLNFLSFEYGIFENFTLSKEKFRGITNVTVLKLRANDLNALEEGFFDNFPELVSLELNRNHLRLGENSFSALSKLRFLSISDNHLEKLPSFRNLSSLEKLDVWKNDIKVIERHTFEGLHNLKVMELGFNKIEEIEEGALDFSPSLVHISFKYNSLKNLSRRTFKSNNLLEKVIVSGNPGLHLENGVFADMKFLNIVDLEGSKLNIIPEDTFENSTSLVDISLGNNDIELIPKDLFKNLINLKKLSLLNNKIKSLDGDTFRSLSKLETLYIQGNELQIINAELLRPLRNLKELNLNNNKIRNIHIDAFGRNKLKKIYLQHNLYEYTDKIYSSSPFNKCVDLEEIDLSYNEVMDFPEDLIYLASMKSINISHNNISSLRVNSLRKVGANELTIDLEYNRISYLNFDYVERTASIYQSNLDAYHITDSPSTIRISQNPIVCDCFAIDFVRYIRNEMHPGVKTSIYFLYDDLLCESPEVLKGISVENLYTDMLSCPIGDVIANFNCTNYEECGCTWRPSDSALVINCQGKNLTSLPEIMHPSKLIYNQTEVHMENNLLVNGPTATDIGFWNVSRLFLGNNSIKSIGWVPPRLEILDLHNNQLENIDYAVLDLMNKTSFQKVSFQGNPWKCDCSAANLTNFLRQHVHQIDTNHIYCVGTSNQLINLNEKDLCPTNSILLASAAVLILCLCVLSSMAALYYRFQREIKVWMYAHNICLFLIEEEELDKDKIYDAFVSYSHKDEDFVIENLISILEGGPKPYKLCLHFRNWIPGEFIAKQVTTSVQDSRRTLVVLSPNFLESVWGKMEFRTAHTEAMREGRARVIIVLYGDVNMDSLDDELKAYMKTNTYIKWGDPWFWDKLKYALPHSRVKGLKNKSQKHANMMKYIEDKFVLVDDRSTSKTDESDSLSKENVKRMDEENVILRNEIA